MLKRTLMATAALVAGASVALAQNPPNADKGVGAAAPMPPSAADKAPGQMKEPGTPARDSAPGQVKPDGQSAKQDAPGQNKAGEAATNADNAGNNKSGGTGNTGKAGDKPDTAANDGNRDNKMGADKPAKNDNVTNKSDGNGGKASLSTVAPEQKTKVRSVFSRHRVEPATGIDVSINVGVSVPRRVKLYSVPQDVLVIVPQYRDYRYFLIGDQICIVDPDTYEIVEIIVVA